MGVSLFGVDDSSLEWKSILTALSEIPADKARTLLGNKGTIAYTDGACIKNPGGPAGWSVVLTPMEATVSDDKRVGTACLECFGHIPRSQSTTNNRAEISAVLAALNIAPRDAPLTIYSDSEYTIKVAQGTFQMKANGDLWILYKTLVNKRSTPPRFEWVRGHAGHDQNERADKLAGLGAWNGDTDAYEKWQASNSPEARNAPPPAELAALRQQVQKLSALFATIDAASGRVAANERTFVADMLKRFLKHTFIPTPAQARWIKSLARKYSA